MDIIKEYQLSSEQERDSLVKSMVSTIEISDEATLIEFYGDFDLSFLNEEHRRAVIVALGKNPAMLKQLHLDGVLLGGRLFIVRPAWATARWWKSTTGLVVGTVSSRQGCPRRRGI